MIGIEKPNIEVFNQEENSTYGKFTLEPLERGFGTTLGNSMRRVLLSSLPGYAITSVKIDGKVHEFDTIPGVKEDITEIVLNLKSVIIKINGDGPKTVYIDATGEGEVTAGDIKGDSEIEIFNPELHIATLDEGATLVMEINMARGRGYVPAEMNKTEDTPISVIPTDSIYTPVRKCNFTVENTRVGQVTDYDKLTLEVWTNGTLSAKDAVSLAAKILNDHLKLFIDLSESEFMTDVLVGRKPEGKGSGDDHRRAGAFGQILQLSEAGSDQYRRRTDTQERRGYDEGQKPRQEVS